MTRQNVELTVTVTLNDEPEDEHLRLARDLARRLKAIADEPQYRDIVLWPIPEDHAIFNPRWDESAVSDD